MSAFAALDSGVRALEAIADFLDDHPSVEIYHRNYRKLPLARTHLRSIRLAAREARRQRLSRQQASLLLEVARSADSLLQRIHNIKKEDYRGEVQSLAERLVLVMPSDELPKLQQFPRRTPKWIMGQVQRDYQEIQKCYGAGANRACVAFSARILECVLGYRFHKKEGIDPVQKGWTLGQLVEESKKRNILTDVVTPGVDHLLGFLNSTRIASVHVKPKVYEPSQSDTRTIVQITLSLVVPLLS
jgi:hypothetical protein